MNLSGNLMLIYIIFIYSQIWMVELDNNQAMKHCVITKVNFLYDYLGKEIIYKKTNGLKCDIKNSDFTLDYESLKVLAKNIQDYQVNKRKGLGQIELNWPSHKKSSNSLTQKFNITALMKLIDNFDYFVRVYFHNLNNIELELFPEPYISISQIYLINSDLRFTIDGKTVKSCAEITSARNGTFEISSLFQIPLVHADTSFYLFGSRFSQKLCPLVFIKCNFLYLRIFDLVDTFYKRNLIKFENQTFENLNSTIYQLDLFYSENLALDTSFLNPSVFRELKYINVRFSLSSISSDLFSSLKNLKEIFLQTIYFRKFIHRNGIEWIKAINRGLHVNLSNLTDYIQNSEKIIRISLYIFKDTFAKPMSKVFPEEDFCIYKDYPFDQLVYTYQVSGDCQDNQTCEFLKTLNPTYSCTYLWITQYYQLFRYVHQNDIISIMSNVLTFLECDSYKNRNNCHFKRRLALCNRSDFHLKDIWGTEDFSILNKKINIAVKTLIYLVSLLSIATNILVIRIIFAKHNKSVFKDFKHYTYLGLISIFSLSISIIEILSWLSECFYPFQVFCLNVHKTIVAQLFKIFVKEILNTTLKFLSNFCYIGFALSRISLIGQEHSAFIKFMSQLTIWKYVVFSSLISVAFSWIKYFKYSINYGLGELNYPILNERDISTPAAILSPIMDFYMVFNVISDLFNYLVFVILSFCVDLGMLVKLRSTVNESIERIKSIGLNEKQIQKKKSDLEDTMKKSIRMVIVNTSIGLIFKIPLVFLPLVNTIAKFFYKNGYIQYRNFNFDRFYTQFLQADFYQLIHDSTELLFLISLFTQYFIYHKFDKKFKEATISPPLVKVNNLKK